MFEVRIGATTFCAFLALSTWARPALPDGIARGDAAYLRRAAGGSDGRAALEPIGEAIRAYQEAIAADPSDLEARWKLLQALYFEGSSRSGSATRSAASSIALGPCLKRG